MLSQNSQVGMLDILFSETPDENGGRFIEVRRWGTLDETHQELIVEFGKVDSKGDLITKCQVLPFYFTIDQVLLELGK